MRPGTTDTWRQRKKLSSPITLLFLERRVDTQQLLQSLCDILIPQTVDQWVQQRGEYRVKHRHHHVLLWGVEGDREHVGVDSSTIEEDDHGHVGGAGGEGLLPALCRVHPENCEEDEGVGA